MPVILILKKEKAVDKELADAVLALPFTVQKLVNRIKSLLPGDGDTMITAGPIRLDVENRRVRSLGKNTSSHPD